MALKISHRSVLFLAGMMMVLFVRSGSCLINAKSDSLASPDHVYSSDFKSDFHIMFSPSAETKSTQASAAASNPPANPFRRSQNYQIEEKKINDKIHKVLLASYKLGEFSEFLTPAVLSRPNLFLYVCEKLQNLDYSKIRRFDYEAQALLKTNQIPKENIPYVEALSSLVRCWCELAYVTDGVVDIRRGRQRNKDGYDTLPEYIVSTPELYEVYSADIFSDPTPPSRLLTKLLNMPEDRLDKLELQLQIFLQKFGDVLVTQSPFPHWYSWYAGFLLKVLENGIVLDDLKCSWNAIRSLPRVDED